jgi:hypothetical protein
MFYEAQILCQRGQLGRVWIAAHWDKKLIKNASYEVASSDIVKDAGTFWREQIVTKEVFVLVWHFPVWKVIVKS